MRFDTVPPCEPEGDRVHVSPARALEDTEPRELKGIARFFPAPPIFSELSYAALLPQPCAPQTIR
jgi:hypothetical protein